MIYEYLFLFSLILTITIETIVLFIIIKQFFKLDKENISDILLLFTGFFASFATLPYLWFLLPFFTRNYYLYIASGELLAFIVESVIYYFILNITVRKALILSFICNLTSFLAGLLLVPVVW